MQTIKLKPILGAADRLSCMCEHAKHELDAVCILLKVSDCVRRVSGGFRKK